MGGVGCESLLFDDVCLESREEAVDGVGEIPRLVVRPCEGEALFRLCSEIWRVVAVIARSGRSTQPATSQPSTLETTAMTASAFADWMSPWCRP